MPRSRPPRPTRPAAAPIPAFFLYGEPLRVPDGQTIHVETIAARSRLHDWTIRPHRHRDLYQLLAVWRGPVEALLDGERQALRGPVLACVPPGTVHAFTFAADTDGLVVSFAAALAREMLRATPELLALLDRPAARALGRAALGATDLAELGRMLLRESGRSARGRDAALRGLLAAFLANAQRLSRGLDAPAPGAGAGARGLVARFREAIELRYREHAGIGSYARELGCSEAALRKACLAVAGQSPVELVHFRLLVEAQRQLRYTGMSITQVAYHLGFEDPAYFSRFFAQRMRMAPRAFRGGAASD